MRIAHLRKPHEFVVEETQTPEPRDHQVLIKVTACGVCKGDFDAWNGLNDRYPLEPGSPGHETYGRIEKKGKSVMSVEIGDVVTAITFPGFGYAEYAVANADEVAKLPPELKG
jgi:D-arabinitol dehydrogenase (NADP+)